MKLTKKINLFLLILLGVFMSWSCSDDYVSFEQQEEGVEYDDVEVCVIDTSTNVTQKLAEKVANKFLASKQSGTTRSSQEIQEITLINDDRGNPSFYIVNYQQNSGFIIISATQKYIPVLAYSTEGHFDVSNMEQASVIYWVQMQKGITQNIEAIPDSSKQLFSQMWTEYNVSKMKLPKTRGSNSDIEELIRSSVTEWKREGYEVYTMSQYIHSSEYRDFSSERKEVIAARISEYSHPDYGDKYGHSFMLKKVESESSGCSSLLTTKWGQQSGFNQFTPNNYPVGCVAVAMGQIMKYHQFPTSFNWNSMADTYATTTTAQFLRDVGMAANTKYGSDESSSDIDKALHAFKNVYGYTNARKVDYNEDDVFRQLDLKRPVYMRGYDSSGFLGMTRKGHAWVCQGYGSVLNITTWTIKTLENSGDIIPRRFTTECVGTDVSQGTYFHMNWGWNGSYDGMYSYWNVNIPGAGLNLAHGRQNIIDIYPNN